MNDLDQIKQRIDIVDYISEFIPVKKTGRNFKANCPFHNEKTPSFIVSPERQIWHCFGCQKGGDHFKFLMEYEKLDFPEALKILALKAGVKLTQSIHKDENEKSKETIYALNHLAATFYNYLLLNHDTGKPALSYLIDTRKISLELIKKFNLGFAPSGNSLFSYLTLKKGYKEGDLYSAGLSVKRGFRTFDFFRNRVIFPIYDTRNNVIAFSGRALNNTDMPKYINTPETLVYRKGDTLFGLNFAKEDIKKENRVIVVEGEFDVISSFKEGIKNIVAVKGTALTENQIKTLKRFAEKISFCFDTDKAGEEAQRRSIRMIEKENILSSVIIPPEGKDPDQLIKENPVLFKKAIKNEVNIYEFIISSALKNYDKNSVEGKRRIMEKTLPFLSLIENEVVKEHFLKKLAIELSSSLESLSKQAGKITNKIERSTVAPVKKASSREEIIEPYLLALIFQSTNVKDAFTKSDSIITGFELSLEPLNRIFKYARDVIASEKDFSVDRIANILPPELIGTFDKLLLAPLPEFENAEKQLLEIEKISQDVRMCIIKNKLKAVTIKIKELEKSGIEEDKEKLKEDFNKLTELMKQYTFPTVGK